MINNSLYQHMENTAIIMGFFAERRKCLKPFTLEEYNTKHCHGVEPKSLSKSTFWRKLHDFKDVFVQGKRLIVIIQHSAYYATNNNSKGQDDSKNQTWHARHPYRAPAIESLKTTSWIEHGRLDNNRKRPMPFKQTGMMQMQLLWWLRNLLLLKCKQETKNGCTTSCSPVNLTPLMKH